jgi:hypothetical protein
MKHYIVCLAIVIAAINCNIGFLENKAATIGDSTDDYINFINGFLKGTNLTDSFAPEIIGCYFGTGGTYQTIKAIQDYIKSGTWSERKVLVMLEEMSDLFQYMFGNFSQTFRHCKNTPQDSLDVFMKIAKSIVNLDLYKQAIGSLVYNPVYIYKEYVKSKILIERGEQFEAGLILGQLFNFVFVPKMPQDVQALFTTDQFILSDSSVTSYTDCARYGKINEDIVSMMKKFTRDNDSSNLTPDTMVKFFNLAKKESPEMMKCLMTALGSSK